MTPTPPNLTEEQKNRLAQRLSMMSHDRADVGQGLPRTARALALGQGSDAGASRLEALVDALVFERVIVPIDVEPDPRVTGVHAGENGHNPIDFVRAQVRDGPGHAIHRVGHRTLAGEQSVELLLVRRRRLHAQPHGGPRLETHDRLAHTRQREQRVQRLRVGNRGEHEGNRQATTLQVQGLVNGSVVRIEGRRRIARGGRRSQRCNQRLELRVDIVVVSAHRSSLYCVSLPKDTVHPRPRA